jgi:uncharacterized protein YjbJ (UPF0337 family)
MSEHKKSDEARKGLFDSVKGKAKEVVGAVTGNDSLTAEGQLEQTQAQERKEANSVEAVADAEAKLANEELAAAKVQGAQERLATDAKTAVVENAVEAQQESQKLAAEVTAQREAAAKKSQAELDAEREVAQAKVQERREVGAAAEDFVDAVDEHQAAVEDADAIENEADRIRRQAKNLNSVADLP